MPEVSSLWWLALPALVGYWGAASVNGSARQPALIVMFAGGLAFLAPPVFVPDPVRIDLLGGLLATVGALHLVLARLPTLSRLELSQLPSSTDEATGAAVAILVRRIIAQVFLESGWPGVEVFGREFTAAMAQKGLRLQIRRNEWVDNEMGSRSTVEFAEVYALGLEQLYEQVQRELGAGLGRSAFSLGLDLIPWEMREIVVEMFAARSRWGEMLNRSLADEKSQRLALLQKVPMFLAASLEECELLAATFATEHFGPGETIVRQGESGDRFYLIQHGAADVWVGDAAGASRQVNRLGPGQFFGEAALISDQPRNATIVASTPVVALTIRREDFDRMVRGRLDSSQTSHNRLRNQWVLRSMRLFDELEGIDIAFLTSLFRKEEFRAGDVVIREGDVGDKFYIVESGELAVTHTRDGVTMELSRRKAGDYFGEIALLEKRPRTATVTAMTDAVLLSLEAQDFHDTIPNFVKMRETLAQSSSRRLSHIQRTERTVMAARNLMTVESDA
jgi:CRP-like cAMP-binding protein